ncbi:DNA alkylation repair enzyme [hydrothermal vent metagenome]|uniref:DNA alkylation repair enzyme n=1 Tax=hydrothermal vent metagenome TaxID=652676 RepID=A0A3B0X5X5_9ZZZZ
MPEPLKNLYSKTLIKNLSDKILQRYSAFDKKAFGSAVFDKNWKDKELKQRMRHIAQCLHLHLPTNYKKAIKILRPVSAQFSGFEYMFFQDYVECYGLDDFATSMPALEHFTKYASSEFAVRAFILQDEKNMMKQMLMWAKSDNHHVRRLASEGCRPRLPWAIALPAFKKNPQPVLKILKVLMKDNSEYVRRSVANNLNDISKDNPEITLNWAQQYLGKNKNTDRLIKHACRTLLKQGDKKTLPLFGFTKPAHISIAQFKCQANVALGDKLNFSFLLNSKKPSLGKCRLEFAIDFMKASGNLNRKVFKISESNYTEKEKTVTKYFSFKKISTRKYYAGKHQLTLVINGVDFVTKPFTLYF